MLSFTRYGRDTIQIRQTTFTFLYHKFTGNDTCMYQILSQSVSFARPQAGSSLKITDSSFRHASPHLWNKLPVSLRQSCLSQKFSPLSSPLSSSIAPSLFYSKFKTYVFQKIFSSIDTHTHQPD